MTYGFCFYLLPVFNLLDHSSLTEKNITSMDTLVGKLFPITAAYLSDFWRRFRLHYVQIIYSLAGRAKPVRVCGEELWTVGQIKCRIYRLEPRPKICHGWKFALLEFCHHAICSELLSLFYNHLPEYPLKDAWRSEMFPPELRWFEVVRSSFSRCYLKNVTRK